MVEDKFEFCMLCALWLYIGIYVCRQVDHIFEVLG
jgi:hypothetical protein